MIMIVTLYYLDLWSVLFNSDDFLTISPIKYWKQIFDKITIPQKSRRLNGPIEIIEAIFDDLSLSFKIWECSALICLAGNISNFVLELCQLIAFSFSSEDLRLVFSKHFENREVMKKNKYKLVLAQKIGFSFFFCQ